jgi:hypothetical protein
MAFRTTTNRLDPDANASAEVYQSTALIPLQYDSLIALVDLARRASHDPLSMCIPLFAHAAFSEVQFLNLMESRIQIQIDAIAEGVSADALGTLQYFSNILNRHAQQLKDSTRAFCRLSEISGLGLSGDRVGTSPHRPSASPGLGSDLCRLAPQSETGRYFGSNSSGGPFTAKGLLEDYEQLHVRCIDLSKMCMRGITLAMNKATIEESRKAVEQSERLKKLTLLATLFIPLTFSSSLFGMNIDLLGQSSVGFWWFLVVCVPITLFAYMIYLWDFQALRQRWLKFRKTYRSLIGAANAEGGEKDPSHIV